jgi:transcriptional regulator with XRE-family HTH domain
MTSNELFGSFIREKRLEKGYTLRKFAEKVDISPVLISYMERDEIKLPTEEKIVAMAEALSMDSEELVFMAKRMPYQMYQMLMKKPLFVRLLKEVLLKSDAELNELILAAEGIRIEGNFGVDIATGQIKRIYCKRN